MGVPYAANSIATVVSTKILKPHHAVMMAAFFNCIAGFFISVKVAKTIGTGIINPAIIDNILIIAALGATIIWNLLNWWMGLPSSSSHALIGGLIGAGIMKGGADVLVWKGIIKTSCFIIISPTIGLILGLLFMIIILNIAYRSTTRVSRANQVFKRLQLFSAAIYRCPEDHGDYSHCSLR